MKTDSMEPVFTISMKSFATLDKPLEGPTQKKKLQVSKLKSLLKVERNQY